MDKKRFLKKMAMISLAAFMLAILGPGWAKAGDTGRVLDISLAEQGNMDLVCVAMNKKYIPNIRPLEGEKLKVYFDLPDFGPYRGTTAGLKGKYVQKVITGYHPGKNKLRIALTLAGGRQYDIQPGFDNTNKKFCLAVHECEFSLNETRTNSKGKEVEILK